MNATVRRSMRRLMRHDERLDADLVDRLWSDPDALMDVGDVLKAGDRTTVVRAGDVVIKRYNLRDPVHTAVHAAMRSRAAWNWTNAERLLAHGLHTPAPRAVVENRVGPARGRSWLVVDYIEGRTLDEVVADADEARLASLATTFASIWHALGAMRIGHDDMKANNFIVDDDDRIWLIDLDGMRVIPVAPLLARQRRLDLERFMRTWQEDRSVAGVFDEAIRSKA